MEAASLRCEGELIRASFWLHCWLKNQRPFLTWCVSFWKRGWGHTVLTHLISICFLCTGFCTLAWHNVPVETSVKSKHLSIVCVTLGGSKCSPGISIIAVGNGLHLSWIYWIWNWWSGLGVCVVTNLSSDLRAHQSLRTTKKWCQYSSLCSDKGNLFKALFKAVKTSGKAGSYFPNGLPCSWCFL